MAYDEPTSDTINKVDTLPVSQDQMDTLTAFIATTIGADGQVNSEMFDAAGSPDAVTVPAGIEQVVIQGGGTYVLNDNDALVIIETDDPVTIVGGGGGQVVQVVGGSDDDLVILDGSLPGGAPAFGTGAVGATVITLAGEDTVVGSTGDDSIDGGPGADSLMGGEGNDLISGGSGSDTVEGGGGFDQMVFEGVDRDGVSVTLTDNELRIAGEASIEADMVSGVEYVSFDNGDPIVTLSDQGSADIAVLYEMLLDRAADAGGLSFWLRVADDGASIVDVALHFISSPEFEAIFGTSLSNAEFVDNLYTLGLEREADTDGAMFWTGLLDSASDETLARARVASAFAEGEEAEALHAYINVVDDPDII